MTGQQRMHVAMQNCKERKNDVFVTPKELAKKYIDWVVQHQGAKDNEVWLDPFRFSGNFYSQFPDNVPRDWCEILGHQPQRPIGH